jgi:protocatechuate 3,4-dioxygenase beta subunit
MSRLLRRSPPIPDPDPRRRALLAALALWPAGIAAPAAWAQAAGDAGLITPSVCLLTPETTAGPFYLDPGLVRADITEGRPGAPLRLVLQVVDADCRPLEGVRVDVWHCDAAGNYSGFGRQGSDRLRDTRGDSFLRGTQFAGPRGVVTFDTIWPGWYRGRTPHVHYRAFLDERTLLTSQLFFPDGASEAVFRDGAYRERAEAQDTTNATDGIARRTGARAYARVAQAGAGWRAELVVGVAPA